MAKNPTPRLAQLQKWGRTLPTLNKLKESPTTAARRILLSGTHGDVLELRAGEGRSLPYYPYPSLRSLTLVDERFTKATHRFEFGEFPVTLLRQTAHTLPYDDCSFDCVCAFFALTSTAEPYRLLAEVRRLLRPRAQLLFIEHAPPSGLTAPFRTGANLLWNVASQGRLNRGRQPLILLEAAGFHLNSVGIAGGRMLYGTAERR